MKKTFFLTLLKSISIHSCVVNDKNAKWWMYLLSFYTARYAFTLYIFYMYTICCPACNFLGIVKCASSRNVWHFVTISNLWQCKATWKEEWKWCRSLPHRDSWLLGDLCCTMSLHYEKKKEFFCIKNIIAVRKKKKLNLP